MITPLYLVSDGKGPAIRVAVLLDGIRIAQWAKTILSDIARSNFARVELALLPEPNEGRAGRLEQAARSSVRRSVVGDQDPGELADCSEWLQDADLVQVPLSARGELAFPPIALAEIARRRIDVIVRLSEALPRGELLRAVRYGVWSYRGAVEGSPSPHRSFHKIIDGEVLRTQLEILAESPSRAVVLAESTFTQHGSMLDALQRQVPTWESTHFVIWKLHDLHQHGWEYVQQHAVTSPASTEEGNPTPKDFAQWLLPRVSSRVRRVFKPERPAVHRWHVGLRPSGSPLWAEPGACKAENFRWLKAPTGHYWADPFLFLHQGKTYLFVEDYDYERGFAGISQMEVFVNGDIGPVTSCLNPGIHLSFPHVFEHDGEIFMLPESLADGTVSLYRARKFPNDWVHEAVLFRGNATDTALWREGDKFYYFTTLFDRIDVGMKTMLFVADSLTGAWRLHPANPISSDVRRSRGAGLIFKESGRLFRPVQNCGPCYGYGFRVEEILTIDPEQYEERTHCWLEPSGLEIPARGVHTYNMGGGFEVIDSYTMGPRTD